MATCVLSKGFTRRFALKNNESVGLSFPFRYFSISLILFNEVLIAQRRFSNFFSDLFQAFEFPNAYSVFVPIPKGAHDLRNGDLVIIKCLEKRETFFSGGLQKMKQSIRFFRLVII